VTASEHMTVGHWLDVGIIPIIIMREYNYMTNHGILGLQEHFTIRRTRLESSVIQRMSKGIARCECQVTMTDLTGMQLQQKQSVCRPATRCACSNAHA